MNEFNVIEKYFRPLTLNRAEALSLTDDGAVIRVPDGYELVVSTDLLLSGTHFLAEESPANIAHKALRVNLSDLAAMGAQPLCYQLGLALPQKPAEDWICAFTAALLEDQKTFGIFCSGGDTTISSNSALGISITVMGLVPMGAAVTRGGAMAGDLAVLSGPIGGAFLGLQALRGALSPEVCPETSPETPDFIHAYRRPVPRTGISDEICRYARAAADISDGLLADLGHICRASHMRARLELGKIPLAGGAQTLIDAGKVTYEALLSGGDDYEVVMAIAPELWGDFQAETTEKGVHAAVIGVFEDGTGVEVLGPDGAPLRISKTGWTHF